MVFKIKYKITRSGNVNIYLQKLGNKAFLLKFAEGVRNTMVEKTKSKIRRGGQAGSPKLSSLTASLKGHNSKLRDTTNLLKSVKGNYSTRFIEFGSDLIYASIQNRGGKIKAKEASKLLIPATRMVKLAQGNGGAKQGLTKLKADGWKLFFSENAVIGVRNKERKLMYIRKKSVNIPARKFLFIDNGDVNAISRVFKRTLVDIKRSV